MIPDVFPFVIVSLISGMSGSILFILGYPEIGGNLFYLNMVLGLCIGVGARLIPMILGLGCAKSYGVKEMWIAGIILTFSCFLEVYWNESYGNLLRFLILLWVYFRYWNAYRFSIFNSAVAWGVRVASLSIVLGTLGLWLFPDFRLEALHLLYINGFSLLTLMVASRVILAHGNYDLTLEFKNWYIKIPVVLIIIATTIRVSAVFINDSYEKQLGYAALTFILAGAVWSVYFIPKILVSKI